MSVCLKIWILGNLSFENHLNFQSTLEGLLVQNVTETDAVSKLVLEFVSYINSIIIYK